MKSLAALLAKQGLTMQDVVYLRAYVAPDATKGGKPDFSAWFRAYSEVFNTKETPVKTARSTVGVSALTNADWLIEIEAIAVYPEKNKGESHGNKQCATFRPTERMKTQRLLLWAALAVATGGMALAFDPIKGPPRTDVVFFEAEKFTDVCDSLSGGSERARDATLSELRTDLVSQANRLLASGQQLKITITDVDLAGEFEPWRGPQWNDVRIVKDIYPPDIKLAFQLTDADGHVLKQGDRNLKDLGFMMNLTIDRNDPLRFEKALLNDWLRDEFHGLKDK